MNIFKLLFLQSMFHSFLLWAVLRFFFYIISKQEIVVAVVVYTIVYTFSHYYEKKYIIITLSHNKHLTSLAFKHDFLLKLNYHQTSLYPQLHRKIQ